LAASALALSAPVGAAAPGAAGPVEGGTAYDVQANNPQVSTDPTSNSTAVFPTNKQNETTIAVNPTDASRLIAGSNDEQRQPPCGPGPVRGATLASDCSFFPGVGTSGIYTSSDGGLTWTNRGLLDDQASWRGSRGHLRRRPGHHLRAQARRRRRLQLCDRSTRLLLEPGHHQRGEGLRIHHRELVG
jgi:hypothetical protein